MKVLKRFRCKTQIEAICFTAKSKFDVVASAVCPDFVVLAQLNLQNNLVSIQLGPAHILTFFGQFVCHPKQVQRISLDTRCHQLSYIWFPIR